MAASLQQRMNYVKEAKVAQQAEQFDKMLESMKNVAKLNVELTLEERDLLRGGFNDAVALRRSNVVIDNHEIPRDNKKMEYELTITCNEVISIIDKHLIPSSSQPESIVLYHTMKGDCYRYLAELKTGSERIEEANCALIVYETATYLAEVELPVSNYVRLGVALNMSKLLYEVMGHKTSAILIAETAYHEAALDKNKESLLNSKVRTMLEKNVELWEPSSELVDETSYLD